MARHLSDEAIRCIGIFEELTGVEAIDCVIDDEFDRIAIVVPPGTLATAIGPGGETVHRVEDRLNRDIRLVEMADRPEEFVANALRPAAVYEVGIEDNVAHPEVSEDDRGAAIGREGRTIELARTLARRLFDLEDVVIR